MADPGKVIVLYRWRVYNSKTKRWKELAWRMTEDNARAWAANNDEQIERIEGSAEERRPIEPGPSTYPPAPGWPRK